MKIYNYICMLLAVLMLSCGDSFLDVTSKESLSDDTFWKDEKDVVLGLNACYRGWENLVNILYLDATTDNGYEQFDYGFQNLSNGQMTPTTAMGTWIDSYAARWFLFDKNRTYNNFLEKVANVEMDENKKTIYVAEVRFLRAYDYFYKVMLYGNMPLVTKVIQNPNEANLSRNPQNEIHEFILAELTDIASILPERNMVESGGHITKGAALALKARLLLYLEKYQEAQDIAESVIQMTCYELFSDYETMFYPENEVLNKEAILSVQYIKENYANIVPQINLPATEGGWSALNAQWSLVDAYQTKDGKYIDDPSSIYDDNKPFINRDPRLEATILGAGMRYNGRYYNPLDRFIDGKEDRKNLDYHEEAAASRGGLLVRKYIYPMDQSELSNYDGNGIVIRLPEMYLTFAECALHTGKKKDIALGYINKIRARVKMPAANLLDERLVKYERRVELAFEGLRYFDIKRWNIGSTTINGAVLGSRYGSVNSQTGEVTWKPGHIKLEDRVFKPERQYLLPIPQTERDRNPNMDQNAGYN